MMRPPYRAHNQRRVNGFRSVCVDAPLTFSGAGSRQMPLDLLVLICLAAMIAVSAAMIYGLMRI